MALYYYNKYVADEYYDNPDASWSLSGSGSGTVQQGYAGVSFTAGDEALGAGWNSTGAYSSLPTDPAGASPGHYYTYEGNGDQAIWYDNLNTASTSWSYDQYSKGCDTTYSQGSYITQLLAEDGTYPNGGYQSGYWWVRSTAYTAPTLTTTTPATNITYQGASIEGKVTATGTESTSHIYLEWGETVTDNSVDKGTYGVGTYGTNIASLDVVTTYYFRIKAVNAGGTFYGTTRSFTTLADVATGTTTTPATSITGDGAVIAGSVTDTGGDNPNVYFEWGQTVTDNSVDKGVLGVGGTSTTLSGLDPNTLYYFRLKMVNSAGTSYGPTRSFTTLVEVAIGTTTTPATLITHESARIAGAVTYTGGVNPTVSFQWGETVTDNDTSKGVLGVESTYLDISGLDPVTLYYFRLKMVNSAGTTYGTTRSLTTTEQPLAMPTVNTPASGTETIDRLPVFDFNLTDTPLNTAVKYHARVRISKTIAMTTFEYEIESKDSQTGWEYLDGTWQAFPAGGVDPATRVRYTQQTNLEYRQTYYWDITSYDQADYGYALAPPFSIRFVLNVEGLYVLNIGGTDYDIYSLRVEEASNGEQGSIEAEIDVTDYAVIGYGDTVILGINDFEGNTEEFGGRLTSKIPSATGMIVRAVLGSGILAERVILEDYTSQDVGAILKAIIDDYCTPLTSTNIDITLGYSTTYPATNLTPLRVFEDLRRRYGFLYFIDADWDVHVYLEAAIGYARNKIIYGDE